MPTFWNFFEDCYQEETPEALAAHSELIRQYTAALSLPPKRPILSSTERQAKRFDDKNRAISDLLNDLLGLKSSPWPRYLTRQNRMWTK